MDVADQADAAQDERAHDDLADVGLARDQAAEVGALDAQQPTSARRRAPLTSISRSLKRSSSPVNWRARRTRNRPAAGRRRRRRRSRSSPRRRRRSRRCGRRARRSARPRRSAPRCRSARPAPSSSALRRGKVCASRAIGSVGSSASAGAVVARRRRRQDRLGHARSLRRASLRARAAGRFRHGARADAAQAGTNFSATPLLQ